jgi:hypothetical protein
MKPRHSSLSVLLGWLAAGASGSVGCGNGQLDSGASTAGGDVELGGEDDRLRPNADGDADSDADADADADADGDADGGDACWDCGEQSCGTQLGTCMDNAECVALGDCGGACEDDACYETCEQNHPNGTTDLFAYYDCLDTRCTVECGGAEPEEGVDPEAGGAEDPGGGQVDPADPCQACVQDWCAGPDQTCVQNAACLAIFDCGDTCAPEDEGCFYACEDDNPAGRDDYFALIDCVYYECPGECGL